MTSKDAALIRRVICYLTGLSVLIAGVCLISACLSIYFGEGGYTRELVSNAFAPISVAVCLCPVLALIGFIAELFLPENTLKGSKKEILATLHKRLSATREDGNPEISRERRARTIRKAVLALILSLSSVAFLVYSLNGAHFDKTEINSSVINAIYALTPLLIACFIAAIIVEILNEKSIKREIELLRRAEKKNLPQESAECGKKQGRLLVIRISILLISLLLIAYGYIIGGTADVLTKAVNICTECIGLG